MFTTNYDKILSQLDLIDPIAYGKSRNFIDGKVTRLSPYISRGVLSTKQVLAHVLNRNFDSYQIEKFIQELAWRDYWQQIWIEKGNAIDHDLRHPQPDVKNWEISTSILKASTSVEAIDDQIIALYEDGYMHNHYRMYVAAIACNMAKSHWKTPAKWMYYHLLDGDWASNALSWQWVAGSNSNKKYVANQENINKYSYTHQRNTFLDVPYEAFSNFEIPNELNETESPGLKTSLPTSDNFKLDSNLPTYLYTSYNLDPIWGNTINANRILLLEPVHFEAYPISKKVLQFILDLGKNIPNLHVFVGSFEDLLRIHHPNNLHYKEHPFNKHFTGTEHSRDWMFSVKGYYKSFFAFWKKCRKELKS